MKGKGWYSEPWRHSLAAKGVRTGKGKQYFVEQETVQKVSPEGVAEASKTEKPTAFPTNTQRQKIVRTRETPLAPTTILGRLRAERDIKKLQEQDVREQRAGVKALRNVQSGDFSSLQDTLTRNDVSAAEKQALRTEANRQAVQLAQAGLDIPESVESQLTSPTKTQIAAIKKQQERASEGAFKRTAREVGGRALEGLEEKARRSEGDVLQEQAAEQRRIENARAQLQGGSSGKLLEDSPVSLFGDNIFLGDGVNGLGKEGTDGSFDFLSDAAQKTTPLSDSIVPREKIAPIDFGINERQKSFSEKLAEEVESMWSSRHNLGEVDKQPLEKGEKAFRIGDREKLIEAINEQEFQIKQQESRWKLVDQTRQLVESQQNRQSIFEDKSKSPFSFSLLFSGADRIADETKKINKVKERVKQGADEARARAANLRGKLQRLDSTVPPEESLPEEEVKVFKQPFTLGDVFSDVFKENPVVEEFDNGV